MAADIIVIAILAFWAAMAVRSYVRDKKNGVPTCGYACASCTGSCGRGVRSPEVRVSRKRLREIRKEIEAREAKTR